MDWTQPLPLYSALPGVTDKRGGEGGLPYENTREVHYGRVKSRAGKQLPRLARSAPASHSIMSTAALNMKMVGPAMRFENGSPYISLPRVLSQDDAIFKAQMNQPSKKTRAALLAEKSKFILRNRLWDAEKSDPLAVKKLVNKTSKLIVGQRRPARKRFRGNMIVLSREFDTASIIQQLSSLTTRKERVSVIRQIASLSQTIRQHELHDIASFISMIPRPQERYELASSLVAGSLYFTAIRACTPLQNGQRHDKMIASILSDIRAAIVLSLEPGGIWSWPEVDRTLMMTQFAPLSAVTAYRNVRPKLMELGVEGLDAIGRLERNLVLTILMDMSSGYVDNQVSIDISRSKMNSKIINESRPTSAATTAVMEAIDAAANDMDDDVAEKVKQRQDEKPKSRKPTSTQGPASANETKEEARNANDTQSSDSENVPPHDDTTTMNDSKDLRESSVVKEPESADEASLAVDGVDVGEQRKVNEGGELLKGEGVATTTTSDAQQIQGVDSSDTQEEETGPINAMVEKESVADVDIAGARMSEENTEGSLEQSPDVGGESSTSPKEADAETQSSQQHGSPTSIPLEKENESAATEYEVQDKDPVTEPMSAGINKDPVKVTESDLSDVKVETESSGKDDGEATVAEATIVTMEAATVPVEGASDTKLGLEEQPMEENSTTKSEVSKLEGEAKEEEEEKEKASGQQVEERAGKEVEASDSMESDEGKEEASIQDPSSETSQIEEQEAATTTATAMDGEILSENPTSDKMNEPESQDEAKDVAITQSDSKTEEEVPSSEKAMDDVSASQNELEVTSTTLQSESDAQVSSGKVSVNDTSLDTPIEAESAEPKSKDSQSQPSGSNTPSVTFAVDEHVSETVLNESDTKREEENPTTSEPSQGEAVESEQQQEEGKVNEATNDAQQQENKEKEETNGSTAAVVVEQEEEEEEEEREKEKEIDKVENAVQNFREKLGIEIEEASAKAARMKQELAQIRANKEAERQAARLRVAAKREEDRLRIAKQREEIEEKLAEEEKRIETEKIERMALIEKGKKEYELMRTESKLKETTDEKISSLTAPLIERSAMNVEAIISAKPDIVTASVPIPNRLDLELPSTSVGLGKKPQVDMESIASTSYSHYEDEQIKIERNIERMREKLAAERAELQANLAAKRASLEQARRLKAEQEKTSAKLSSGPISAPSFSTIDDVKNQTNRTYNDASLSSILNERLAGIEDNSSLQSTIPINSSHSMRMLQERHLQHQSFNPHFLGNNNANAAFGLGAALGSTSSTSANPSSRFDISAITKTTQRLAVPPMTSSVPMAPLSGIVSGPAYHHHHHHPAHTSATPTNLTTTETERLADVMEYAVYLGMDPIADKDLFYIAEWAINAPLPEGWTEHLDEENNEFYYNSMTGVSTYEHPLDEQYRAYYRQIKAQRQDSSKRVLAK